MAITSTAYHAGYHCQLHELLDPLPACPLCGFRGERKPVLTVQEDPVVVLLRCPRCKGASASRMPKPDTLFSYYARYRQDTDLRVTFFSPSKFAAHILELLGNRLSGEGVRILDFGGADGSLSIAIAEQLLSRKAHASPSSVSIDLIDHSQQAASPSKPAVFINQLSSLNQAPAAAYDLAIASSVMEHIPEPTQDFRALFEALKLGGCFYARTPYIVPVLRILRKFGRSYDFTYPAHVHDMGKDFWEGLVKDLPGHPEGMNICHSAPSPVETTFRQAPLRTAVAYLLKYPWRLAPKHYNLVGGWEVLFQRAS